MIENQKARIGQSVKFQAELPSEETQIEWFVGEFKQALISANYNFKLII